MEINLWKGKLSTSYLIIFRKKNMKVAYNNNTEYL